MPEMDEKITAMQDRTSRKPCRISIPEMIEIFTAMSQPCKIGCPRDACIKLTAIQDKYSKDVGKVHSHARKVFQR